MSALDDLRPGEAMESVAGPSFRRGYTRALDDVREALRSDETRAQVVAAIPHADWCCTKGCVLAGGLHYVDVPDAVPMPDGPTVIDALPSWEPCRGDCTCEVGMIVPQVLAVLAGDDQ